MDTSKLSATPPERDPPKAGWRIKTGFAIFIASIVWPILLPLLPFLGLSSQSIAALTGIMVIVAEVMMVAAAAIAGKDGFSYIKKRILGLLKSYGPPQRVGRARYRIGLVIFLLPLVYALLSPYVTEYVHRLADFRLVLAIVGDILLLVALFLLGGEFWDKLRSLFYHRAVAVIPEEAVKSEKERSE